MDYDEAYANAAFIPDGASYPDRWAAQAEAFRAEWPLSQIDVAYGFAPRERFDLFHPQRLARGTLVFVHGGYWRAFDKSLWSHLAAGALARGWAVAMPSYTLAPEARISGITAQVAQAVDAIARRCPGPLRLAGHSAGGHLVARMLCADVPLAARGRIAHVMPISPVADLEPLMQTQMNADLGIDAAEAAAESPVHHPAPECDVTVWVGGAERPAFLEQAKALADAWACGHVVAGDKHHFDVIEPLADPQSEMVVRLLG